jgi:hypothetical protein
MVLRATSQGATVDLTITPPWGSVSAVGPVVFDHRDLLANGVLGTATDQGPGFSYRANILQDRLRRLTRISRNAMIRFGNGPVIDGRVVPETAATLPGYILGITVEVVGSGLQVWWRRASGAHTATFQLSVSGGAFQAEGATPVTGT